MSQTTKADANEHVNPHGGVDMNFDHSETATLAATAPATNWSQFGTLISVFFFWGFVAASNSIFIPFCKEYFQLDQIQSQLVGSAFYGAYFYGSLALYLASYLSGTDILNKIGYKKGIIYGLLISMVGSLALAFISGSGNATFPMILVAFFIIALGFSLQQTSAQPFAASLGSPETGAHRLNMAGGVNSFGTLLGPLIVSFLLFGAANATNVKADVSRIQVLYFFLSGLFIFAAIVFSVAKLPKTTTNEKLERSPKALRTLLIIGVVFLPVLFAEAIHENTGVPKAYIIVGSLLVILALLFGSMVAAKKNPVGWGAMSYPQLVLGMVAIFIYVGVEVTVDNNFGALLKRTEFGGFDESQMSHLIALYWGSLMIGRWTGAISVFNVNKKTKQLLTIIVPFIAFAVIVLANLVKGSPIGDYKYYPIFILFLIAANLYAQERPIKLLLSVSVLGVLFILVSLLTTGMTANYAIIATGLCCSVMWPCIFALAITGLGKYTSQASAFLITMILGGAIIPPSQGAIIDLDRGTEVNGITTGPYTHLSYLVPLACFAYLAWHTLKTKSVLKAQGLDVDQQVAGGH
ncbi:MFS transporter, FHS family, L-fucose permease [Cnuella takakiae]|uniref:MFS transporter, FHS family, L-fucose permease n=1 Tax=Cnuella takakiae TaxID=1302690 RepID=A0A1M4V288_9BACT|nr:MFS transporter [Cnuella takakiae]SHE62983.1 MFS transporter, FHS family, L-fucose permease [Cnuella takakiae]